MLYQSSLSHAPQLCFGDQEKIQIKQSNILFLFKEQTLPIILWQQRIFFIHIDTYKHTHTHIHTHLHTLMYAHTDTHTHALCIHTRTHTHTLCMHAHTHAACIHTHTHTHSPSTPTNLKTRTVSELIPKQRDEEECCKNSLNKPTLQQTIYSNDRYISFTRDGEKWMTSLTILSMQLIHLDQWLQQKMIVFFFSFLLFVWMSFIPPCPDPHNIFQRAWMQAGEGMHNWRSLCTLHVRLQLW